MNTTYIKTSKIHYTFISLLLFTVATLQTINYLINNYEKNENARITKAVKLVIERESDFMDSYALAKRLLELDSFNFTLCSKLERISPTRVIIFDLTSKLECKQIDESFSSIQFKNRMGDYWVFNFLPNAKPLFAHNKQLIYVITIILSSLIFFTIWRDQKAKTQLILERKKIYDGIVHDIMSPLATLKGLQQREIHSPILERTIHKIESLMASLKEQNQISPKIIGIQAFLNDFSEEKRTEIDPNTKLEISISQNIYVIADIIHLKRILSNLVNNSIEATQGSALIKITSIIEDGNAVIRLTDNGSGFPESIRKTLGKDRISTKGEERGFGLSQAYATLQQMKGTMEVEASSHTGSTLKLTLPLVCPLGLPKRLILIEDDKYITMDWQYKASQLSIPIIAFSSSKSSEFANLVPEQGDVIFIDKNIGDEDGLIVSKQLFERGWHEIWLETGEQIPQQDLPIWIKGTCSKDFPFTHKLL